MSICDLQTIRKVDSVIQFKEGQGKFMDHRSIKEMLVEKGRNEPSNIFNMVTMDVGRLQWAWTAESNQACTHSP